MSSPYVGEIRMFGGNFPPNGWAFCQGQSMPISEYETLFNLIGTTYGGDGQETFNLPNLGGRLPLHMGYGYQIGQMGGVARSHSRSSRPVARACADGLHGPVFRHQPPELRLRPPAGRGRADGLRDHRAVRSDRPSSVAPTGGSQPHDNMQPYCCGELHHLAVRHLPPAELGGLRWIRS